MAIQTTNAATVSGEAHLDAESYKFLQEYVYRESGIVLDGDKQYLIKARLAPLVRQHQLTSISDLCSLMRATGHQSVRRSVVEAMTTNETFFFRDLAQYDALKSTVIPALLKHRQATRMLRFWSAASSTGQEAYSLAIMLKEMSLGNWRFEILGTDLSEQVVAKARSGRYLQLEVNRGLPVNHLLRFFSRNGLDWEAKEELRQMARFETWDLRQNAAAKGPFDIVFCRNVLIYFDIPTKQKILSNLRAAMAPGSYLLLGGSETLMNIDDRFQRHSIQGATIYQLP